jgi:hypothetical protein
MSVGWPEPELVKRIHEMWVEENTAHPHNAAILTKIYVIRCGDFIKIGHALTPERRLREMRIGCPYPMEMLHVVDGRIALEKELHRAFRLHRLRREWFKIEGRVKEWIEAGFPVVNRH